MRKINLFLVVIIAYILSVLGCSTNYNEKLINKVWANTNTFFYGDYLWSFDGKGTMINLNYEQASGNKEATIKYVIDGNQIKFTKENKIEEATIKFNNDNEFSLIDGKHTAVFKEATFIDSIVGDWDNTIKLEEEGLLTDIKFSPKDNCDFKLIGDNFFGDLYGGEYTINENDITLKGKEKNYGKNEKDYKGRIKVKILSLDSIQIIQNYEKMIFVRSKFK